MDNFYIAVISCSALFFTISIATIIEYIARIRRKLSQIELDIQRQSHILTQYRRITNFALNHSCINENLYGTYCRNRNNIVLEKEHYGAWAVFSAMEHIVGKEDDYLYDNNIKPKYTVKELDEYTKWANAIWFYIENKQNSCEAFSCDDIVYGLGYSKKKLKKVLAELAPAERYGSINKDSYSSISGDIEVEIIPQLRAGLQAQEYINKKLDLQYIYIALGILFCIGVILPLCALHYHINNPIFSNSILWLVLGVITSAIILIYKKLIK